MTDPKDNFNDPLAEGVKEMSRGAKRGFFAALQNLFSFGSFKFFSVLAVVMGFGIALFGFGVFGGTEIGLTLRSNPDLARGLVAHWTFDGENLRSNVADSSGNGNNAYLSGFISTTTISGRLGQGLEFDGTDDYVDATLSSEAVRTVAFWVKGTSTTQKVLELTSPSAADWYDANYDYCREFTMTAGGDSGGVATTTTLGMPFVATSTIAELAATSSGSSSGKVQKLDATNSYPLDVVFVAGDDCNDNSGALLDFYFEDYSSTTGAFVAWIEPTDVSSTTAKSVLMYYGNSSATDQTDEAGVWDGATDWVAVWNMDEDPGGTAPQLDDSTANNNDWTTTGSMSSADQVDAVVNGGVDFDGFNDAADVADSASFDTIQGNNMVTTMFWLETTDAGSEDWIFTQYDGSSGDEDYLVGTRGGILQTFFRDQGGWVSSGTAINDGVMHHLVSRFNGDRLYHYVDGVQVQDFNVNVIMGSSANGWELLDDSAFSDSIPAVVLDDMRVTASAPDPMDILTYYNNTSDSAAFWTIGNEETEAGGTFSVELASGVAAANDFTSPTIYVDGEATSTVSDTDWHHVVVTSNTAVTVDEVDIGRISTTYFEGSLDDVRLYDRVLSAEEVKRIYELGATTHINITIDTNPSLQNGLLGHWTFDGEHMLSHVADISSNGRTASLGGFTSTTTIPGALGQALSFDGVNDYATVPDSAALDFGSGETITIATWVRPETLEYSELVIKGRADESTTANYSFRQADTGQLQFYYRDRDSLAWQIWTSTSAHLAVGAWTHVMVTYTFGTGSSIKLYVNGVEAAGSWTTNSGNVAPVENNETLVFGSKRYNAGGADPDTYFHGALDDIRIYNRALSAEERSRLYELGATTHINTTFSSGSLDDGLVGHYTFDGKKMYSNVADSSGQGNTGYLSGFTSTTTVIGRLGQALSFGDSGDNNYVNLSSVLSSFSGYETTVSAWVRITSFDTNGAMLFSSTNGAGENLWWQLGTPTNVIYLHGNTVSISPSLSTDTWYHVAFVTLDSDSTRIYVNGALAGSEDGTAVREIVSGAKDFQIGYYVGGDGWDFGGVVDDVRVYNRALSAEEVKRLYDMGR